MQATLFLVQARIRQDNYMSISEIIEEVRLVYAADADEAQKKYEEYWRNRDVTYYVSHCIESINITEAIP
jgi:hypothetical protein